MLTQNSLRTYKGKYLFFEKKKTYLTISDLYKCLKQTRWQKLLHVHTEHSVTIKYKYHDISPYNDDCHLENPQNFAKTKLREKISLKNEQNYIITISCLFLLHLKWEKLSYDPKFSR